MTTPAHARPCQPELLRWWLHLPPGYRPLLNAELETARLERSSVNLAWHPAENKWLTADKMGDMALSVMATPSLGGAPPGYRRVKNVNGQFTRAGMKRFSALLGFWEDVERVGRLIVTGDTLIEPEPPPGWDWVGHRPVESGDRVIVHDRDVNQQVWAKDDTFGIEPLTPYRFIRRNTKSPLAEMLKPEIKDYAEWGGF